MTPKKKAIDLILKFQFKQENIRKELAKRAALIAVDEILWEIIKYADNSKEYVIENLKYWQEVKQEIEKL